MAGLSPMMRQYVDIKDKNKDVLLFFRVGDFYEMFFDDAVLASKELELTLTGKGGGLEERVPMCGVPHHSVEAYVARLIEKGYKVAICEQMEEAGPGKALVEREIVRVVTPGTVIESSMLQDDKNNYIASVYIKGDSAGLCFADISCGTTKITECTGKQLYKKIIEEFARFSPKEILFNSEILNYKQVTDYIKKQQPSNVELLDDDEFSEGTSKKRLAEHFSGQEQLKQELDYSSLAGIAFSALLGYLHETQKKGVERLKFLQTYNTSQYMNLPPVTRINLELCETMRAREKRGTLFWVLDKTSTAMGKRLLRQWIERPLVDSVLINRRLEAVKELFTNNIARLEICETLSGVFDIERLMTRAVYGSATPRDIQALGATCQKLPGIKHQLTQFKCEKLTEINLGIDPMQDISDEILKTLSDDLPAKMKDGGIIRTGFNSEVDELRKILHGNKDILAGIEAKLKEETGIRTLKIGYNKVFGYYIEVSKSFVEQVPPDFVRKQTLTTGERYITDELKQIENKILGAGERLSVLENELFNALLQRIGSELLRMQNTAENIAKLDVIAGLAQVALANKYNFPIVDDSDVFHIIEGRHPVVEQVQKGSLFVPNDTKLDCGDNRMQIITGPNMAGKSTYMRQTALIAIMAQIGSFVPAKSCHIGVCDAVFTRVGAADDLAQGQSTFMVEMTEVSQIINNASKKSLIILDEIGRGTSTFDGMSIAQAVVEYLADPTYNIACKTMFATHYHELTALENSVEGVKNYNIAVKKRGDDITFLRRIVRGAADDSYGIQVAKLAGLPDDIILRAKKILKALEAQGNKTNVATQLDFDAVEDLNKIDAPSELMEKLRQADPETLTPLEALKLVYELKACL